MAIDLEFLMKRAIYLVDNDNHYCQIFDYKEYKPYWKYLNKITEFQFGEFFLERDKKDKDFFFVTRNHSKFLISNKKEIQFLSKEEIIYTQKTGQKLAVIQCRLQNAYEFFKHDGLTLNEEACLSYISRATLRASDFI